MTANDRQVGGSHYQTGGTQHWDLFGPEYLVGCATKYVSRWRKKNGIEDLKKAKHFAEKLLEEEGWFYKDTLDLDLLTGWGKNLGLDWVEMQIIQHLVYQNSEADLKTAIEGIDYLISSAQGRVRGSIIVTGNPVGVEFYVPGTPEDGGHHARQPHD